MRELVRSGDQASPDMPVAGLVDVFHERPELDSVALVAGARPEHDDAAGIPRAAP